MNWKVPLADLDYGEEEEQAVLNVLRQRWLTMGEVTRQFEEEFAAMLGCRYALAVSNATVALHLACLALDIGPGDEVIVPSLTFVATSNAVLYTGATVRFADILGLDEPTIDPSEIEKLISPRTKAIIIMHYAGHPCRINEIKMLADKYHLHVIEDAAHAPGGALDNQFLGSWGVIGCFSFFSNKNLSTGEGGMVTTNDKDIADKIRLLRSHGMTSLTWDRHQGHAYSYDVVDLGYNYRIDEIHSALGLVQLNKLTENNLKRENIVHKYWDAFQDSGLGLPFRKQAQEENVQPAYHIFPITLPKNFSRKAFIDSLRESGIQTSIHYPPIHLFTYYSKVFPDLHLPQTELYASREVTLPLYPSLPSDKLSLVIDSVNQSLAR